MSWEVRLIGNDADLGMLSESFSDPSVTITSRGSEFFLGGTQFDDLRDAGAVRAKALEVIAWVSGASRVLLGSSNAVQVDLIVQVDEGKRHFTLFPDPAVVSVRALQPTLTVTSSAGSVERRLPGDLVVAAVRKARLSTAVQKVLRLRNVDELQWGDFTRILEVVRADGGHVNASDEEVGRLTGSENHPDVAGDLARHGAPKWAPPPPHKRMTLHEARDLIDRIIRDWLRSRTG